MPGQTLTYVNFALKIGLSAIIGILVSFMYKEAYFELEIYIDATKGFLAGITAFSFFCAYIFEERGYDEGGYTFSRILLLVDAVLNLVGLSTLFLIRPNASAIASASILYMLVETLMVFVLYSYNKLPHTEPTFE